MSKKILIIGGGAAGLMAAGSAAENGAQVLVLEKMKRPGRKICITGKGRCNITNVADLPDFLDHFDHSGKFLRQPFSRYFSGELLDFLKIRGLALVTERGGRVFPASGKAPDVLRVFLEWCEELGVTIKTTTTVKSLKIKDGKLIGVNTNNGSYNADAVIMTTGGTSYPATGSSGDGYPLAQQAGHKIIEPRPALVPLETSGIDSSTFSELSLRNIQATLYANGKQIASQFGELTFMKFGVSGPVVLKMSKYAVFELHKKKTVHLILDLKPALDEFKLDQRLVRDINRRGSEPVKDFMRGLLPKPLIPEFSKLSGLNLNKKTAEITSVERKDLVQYLKCWKINISGHRPFEEAIITAGGVDLKDVDPRTMESTLVKNLYFAGEVLDIQADTGGYNLQAAFSTGWLAGVSAATVY